MYRIQRNKGLEIVNNSRGYNRRNVPLNKSFPYKPIPKKFKPSQARAPNRRTTTNKSRSVGNRIENERERLCDATDLPR